MEESKNYFLCEGGVLQYLNDIEREGEIAKSNIATVHVNTEMSSS